MTEDRLLVRVARVTDEADDIKCFELVPTSGAALPPFEAGAHVDVQVPKGPLRSYSLCNPPWETHRYVIAVQREAKGRGGSRALHEQVREGTTLDVRPPRNDFRLIPGDHTLLIAGGIGVTPLLAMVHALDRTSHPFTLHYCARSPERTAFRVLLQSPQFAANVHLHHDGGDPSKGLDVQGLLQARPRGGELYCCGPGPLMNAVREAALKGGWPSAAMHFESFSAEGIAPTRANHPFEVSLRSNGKVFTVPAERSLLSALRDQGLDVPSDCEAGTCGTCYTRLCEGQADHRDTFLSEEERNAHRGLCPCVSRARTPRLVLDL